MAAALARFLLIASDIRHLQPKEGRMSQQKVEGTRKPAKRLLATGRKINGTWEVRTFLRLGAANAAGGNETFWERWRWSRNAS